MSEETLLDLMEDESDEEFDEVDGRINPFKILPHVLLMRAIRRQTSRPTPESQGIDMNESDFKKRDSFQRNLIHYAVSKPETLRKILKNPKTQTCIKEAIRQEDYEGETPVHHAAAIGNIESLQILHDYDKSLLELKTGGDDNSVLHLVVKSRSVAAVKFILSKAPRLMNKVDKKNRQTPAHYAASLKQPNVLEVLISKGCDTTEIQDRNGQLPIHIAASKGLRNNVELLLREGLVIDAVDVFDRTPIMLAAINDFPNLVSYLLTKNANWKLRDKNNYTAFDLAVLRTRPEVVKVLIGLDEDNHKDGWRAVVNSYHEDPEACLAEMVKNMPEIAKLLLDKCITTKNKKEVVYDFFCLESPESSCPRCIALEMMVENECEICLRHPVAVKYVDRKWIQRGFRYTVCLILMHLLFHVCLMVYTMRVIGAERRRTKLRHEEGKNVTMNALGTKVPNDTEIVILRVIMLIIAAGALSKDALQMFVDRLHYFSRKHRIFRLALYISVLPYLFPVNQKLSARQIGYGAVAVLLSWLNLNQFFQLVPILGIYIILVQKIFWTLVKIFIVVAIFLLSFATTFYVLLAEYDSFRNILISFVSTFVGMTNGLDYDNLFVAVGWYPTIYELKIIIFILFLLTSIVMNNALIGLAVGDANEVMKSASFDKFLRRAEFIIQLERNMSKIPYFRCKENKEPYVESLEKKKNVFQKMWDLLYLGGKIDVVDGASDEQENEIDNSWEEHFEKAVDSKLENLRLNLRHELKEVQKIIEGNLEERFGKKRKS